MLVAAQLHDVRPTDQGSVAAAVGLLLAAAPVASLVPALRAARVDPMVALREE